ncbi:hypothetical protein M8J75_007308 [Diaphorina citri]|nr:hypothetical protein M8J75_007308 [Diaphorina citri]
MIHLMYKDDNMSHTAIFNFPELFKDGRQQVEDEPAYVAPAVCFTCLKSNLSSRDAIMGPSVPSRRLRRANLKEVRESAYQGPSRLGEAAGLSESMHKGCSFMNIKLN